MTTNLQQKSYTLDMLRDETKGLVEQGIISQQQPIYSLCRYLPEREWECVELCLEESEYLLRDRIIDLLNQEQWDND